MQDSLPLAGAVSGFFEQFALGSGERGFAIVDASGGQFPHHRLRGVAILAFEQDAGLGLAGGFRRAIVGQIIDGENNDGSGMPYDIATSTHASRFFHFIGGDAEYRAPVTDSGREDAGLP